MNEYINESTFSTPTLAQCNHSQTAVVSRGSILAKFAIKHIIKLYLTVYLKGL